MLKADSARPTQRRHVRCRQVTGSARSGPTSALTDANSEDYRRRRGGSRSSSSLTESFPRGIQRRRLEWRKRVDSQAWLRKVPRRDQEVILARSVGTPTCRPSVGLLTDLHRVRDSCGARTAARASLRSSRHQLILLHDGALATKRGAARNRCGVVGHLSSGRRARVDRWRDVRVAHSRGAARLAQPRRRTVACVTGGHRERGGRRARTRVALHAFVRPAHGTAGAYAGRVNETASSAAGGGSVAADLRTATEMLELDPAECLRLLAEETVGRIAVDAPHRPQPVIRPVNDVFDEPSQSVLIRSGSGSKLFALLCTVRAAFEIDGIDPVDRVGWSVIIQGSTEEITNPAELRRIEALGLEPGRPVTGATGSGSAQAPSRAAGSCRWLRSRRTNGRSRAIRSWAARCGAFPPSGTAHARAPACDDPGF